MRPPARPIPAAPAPPAPPTCPIGVGRTRPGRGAARCTAAGHRPAEREPAVPSAAAVADAGAGLRRASPGGAVAARRRPSARRRRGRANRRAPCRAATATAPRSAGDEQRECPIDTGRRRAARPRGARPGACRVSEPRQAAGPPPRRSGPAPTRGHPRPNNSPATPPQSQTAIPTRGRDAITARRSRRRTAGDPGRPFSPPPLRRSAHPGVGVGQPRLDRTIADAETTNDRFPPARAPVRATAVESSSRLAARQAEQRSRQLHLALVLVVDDPRRGVGDRPSAIRAAREPASPAA